jgi:hypothetical protein
MKNALGYTFTNCYLEQLVLDECIKATHLSDVSEQHVLLCAAIKDLNSRLSHLAFLCPKTSYS